MKKRRADWLREVARLTSHLVVTVSSQCKVCTDFWCKACTVYRAGCSVAVYIQPGEVTSHQTAKVVGWEN